MLGFQKSQSGKVLLLCCLIILGFSFAATPGQAQKAPKGKIVVVTSTPFGLSGGDCHTASGGLSISVASLIHDSLWRKKPDGQTHAALAKSWQLARDAKSIKIKLDEKARFHNNMPVTAEDVKFSIERMQRPELKFVTALELKRAIDRIEIQDKLNLTIFFKIPYSVFIEGFSSPLNGIVPKAYVEKVGNDEFAKHPIGAGPFRWVDYKQDVYVEVEAVENHHFQTPQVKQIRFMCVPEDVTRMAMLKAGEADLIALPVRTFMEIKNDPGLRIVWSKFTNMDSLAFYDLYTPGTKSPFADLRVRRAASYAINRKAICEKVLHGASEPWGDILAPYEPGADPAIPIPAYDPEKAKALLKEAGYAQGLDTTLTCGPVKMIQLQAVAADLTKVGIRAKVVMPEMGMYHRQIMEKSLNGLGIHLNPWWASMYHPFAALWSTISTATPWAGPTSPEANAQLMKLLTVTDEKELAVESRKLSKIYREAEIRYPLWANHSPFGLGKKVKKWEPIPGAAYVCALEFLELAE
jgi:peptide/nickel transport system substrate-binding protein